MLIKSARSLFMIVAVTALLGNHRCESPPTYSDMDSYYYDEGNTCNEDWHILSATWSPDGEAVAIVEDACRISVRTVTDGTEIASMTSHHAIYNLDWGDWGIVVTEHSQTIEIFTPSGALVEAKTIDTMYFCGYPGAQARGNFVLIAGCYDFEVRGRDWSLVWQPDSDFRIATVDKNGAAIAAWNSRSGNAVVFSLPEFERILTFSIGYATVSMAWSADDARLAATDWDGDLRVWDVASGKKEWRQRGHDPANDRYYDYYSQAFWSVDGRKLALQKYVGYEIWDTETFERLAGQESQSAYISFVQWSPTGDQYIVMDETQKLGPAGQVGIPTVRVLDFAAQIEVTAWTYPNATLNYWKRK